MHGHDSVSPVARVDYTGRADAYARSRNLPEAVLTEWAAAINRLLLPQAGMVLDLGAGPGGFLDALAEWSGASVVAIEPSPAMRARAGESGLVHRYPYVAAVAEGLPLASGSIDWVWLSTVIHQVDDLDQAAGEVARVLRPDGCVLIRGFFSDVPLTGLLANFPGSERSARAFPSTARIADAFRAAGLPLQDVVDVVEPWVWDLPTWVARVRALRDTDSACRPLTDSEVDEGIRRVTASHAAGEPLRSDGTIRLLCLRRAGRRA